MTLTDNNRLLEAKKQLLQLLALGFQHPNKSMTLRIARGEYQAALWQAISILNLDFPEIDSLKPKVDMPPQIFEAEYIDLFNTGRNGKPLVHLNAGDYKALLDGHSRPEFILGFSRWYKYFGLELRSDSSLNLLPDHITCALELLAYLCSLELIHKEDVDLQRGYLKARGDFIERHTGPFISALHQSLTRHQERNTTATFYSALVTILKKFTDSEIAHSTSGNATHIASVQITEVTKEQTSVNLWG